LPGLHRHRWMLGVDDVEPVLVPPIDRDSRGETQQEAKAVRFVEDDPLARAGARLKDPQIRQDGVVPDVPLLECLSTRHGALRPRFTQLDGGLYNARTYTDRTSLLKGASLPEGAGLGRRASAVDASVPSLR